MKENSENFSESQENYKIPQWIIDDLNKSGLTPETFSIEPLQSQGELIERLGFITIQDDSGSWQKIIDIGGYWIVYPNVPGYYRLKLREKTGDVKYLSPKDKGNHAYILPQVAEIAKNYNPDKPVFITEGEKKAAKATLEGFPAIALPGVFGFVDKEHSFLPEIEELVWKDRTAYIVFDSDIMNKFQVQRAEIRLAVELMNRGARVYSVRLPNVEVEQ